MRSVWVCVLVACGGGSHAPTDAPTDTSTDAPMQRVCPILPANHIFNTRIDGLPADPGSANYIATIGDALHLHLDLGTQTDQQAADFYGIPSNVVKGSSFPWPAVAYTSTDPSLSWNPLAQSDCGDAGGAVQSPCPASPAYLPIPTSPIVEGGIQTDQSVYGDHHMLLLDSDSCRLWETFHSYQTSSGGWDVFGSAEFDLTSNALRPAGWASADAAGFPIYPLLLRAEEASSGAIHHAMRFKISAGSIRNAYVWPARHMADKGTTNITLPPMGQLFRLKAGFQIPASWGTQSIAIATALKQYGMYIADAGPAMYIQGEPSASWAATTVSELQSLQAMDFEAVDVTPIMQRAGFDPSSGAVP
jgi:hypothetical protein